MDIDAIAFQTEGNKIAGRPVRLKLSGEETGSLMDAGQYVDVADITDDPGRWLPERHAGAEEFLRTVRLDVGLCDCVFLLNGKLVTDGAFKGTARVPYISADRPYAWKDPATKDFAGYWPEVRRLTAERRYFIPGIGQPRRHGWYLLGAFPEFKD